MIHVKFNWQPRGAHATEVTLLYSKTAGTRWMINPYSVNPPRYGLYFNSADKTDVYLGPAGTTHPLMTEAGYAVEVDVTAFAPRLVSLYITNWSPTPYMAGSWDTALKISLSAGDYLNQGVQEGQAQYMFTLSTSYGYLSTDEIQLITPVDLYHFFDTHRGVQFGGWENSTGGNLSGVATITDLWDDDLTTGILSFTATPATAVGPKAVTLTWTTKNATAVAINGGTVFQGGGGSGSAVVQGPQTTTFTMVATGDGPGPHYTDTQVLTVP